jgi:hypothetical protein
MTFPVFFFLEKRKLSQTCWFFLSCRKYFLEREIFVEDPIFRVFAKNLGKIFLFSNFPQNFFTKAIIYYRKNE